MPLPWWTSRSIVRERRALAPEPPQADDPIVKNAVALTVFGKGVVGAAGQVHPEPAGQGGAGRFQGPANHP